MAEKVGFVRWKTPLGIREYVRLGSGLLLFEDLLEEISVNFRLLASMVLTRECVDTPTAEKDGG
jgi:hypothetical protein